MWPSLLGFSGRIGRRQYLGYAALVYAAAFGLLMFGFMAAYGAFGRLGAYPAVDYGLFGLWVVLLLVCAWAGIALVVKRLRDLSFLAVHVIWITLLGVAAIILLESRKVPGVGEVVAVAALVAPFLLMVVPGSKRQTRLGPPR